MTADQATLARQLLRQAIDWIGLDDLTEEQEEQATALQVRIERLLVDLGEFAGPGLPKRDRVEDLYALNLSQRAYLDRAERERDECRARMNGCLQHPGDAEHRRYCIRRFSVAYTQWEEAERLMKQAHAAYYRALLEAGQ